MKKYLPFLIFAILELAVCLAPIAYVPKLAAALLLILGYTYYRRQVFFYLKGLGLIQKGKQKQAFVWFERALKSNVNEDGELTIANYYILFGDMQRGNQILDHFLTRKLENPQHKNMAEMLKALVVYRQGDTKGAIGMMEKMRSEGYRSVALYADLMLMYLDEGNIDTALELWNEADADLKKDVGLRDVYGRTLILQGKWEEAYKLYRPMLQEPVHVVNEFIHASQVFVHYGMAKEALLCLTESKKGPFNQVNPFTREMVDRLYDTLKDPATRLATAHMMDEHASEIAAGKLPEPSRKQYPVCDDDHMDGFSTLPRNLANIAGQKEERRVQEAMPNTDLDESDEEYLARHQEDRE